MHKSLLSVTLGLGLVSVGWALLAPTDAGANQHAPVGNFSTWLGDFELLVEGVSGPAEVGAGDVLTVYTVPQGKTLILTDTQVRASFGASPFLLRDGQRVAEVTLLFQDFVPAPTGTRTTTGAGIYFPPGSQVQLELPSQLQVEFLSLRGYFQNNPRWTSVHVP